MTPQRASNVLKLEPNVPTELSLQTPSSLNVDGQYGPQTLFTLTGNRRLYVPLEVGKEIASLTLAPGQPFIICKRSRATGRGFDWEVSRKATEFQETRHNAPAPTQIEHGLKTAIAAAAAAERYATEIGYTVRFSEESIRAMGITILIGQQRAA